MALYGVTKVRGGKWLAVIEIGPEVEGGERVITAFPDFPPFYDAAISFCRTQRNDPQEWREKEFVAKSAEWRRSLGKLGEWKANEY